MATKRDKPGFDRSYFVGRKAIYDMHMQLTNHHPERAKAMTDEYIIKKYGSLAAYATEEKAYNANKEKFESIKPREVSSKTPEEVLEFMQRNQPDMDWNLEKVLDRFPELKSREKPNKSKWNGKSLNQDTDDDTEDEENEIDYDAYPSDLSEDELNLIQNHEFMPFGIEYHREQQEKDANWTINDSINAAEKQLQEVLSQQEAENNED